MNGRITTIKGVLSLFGYQFYGILGIGDFATCYEIYRNGEAFVFKVFKQNNVKRRKSKLSLESKLLKAVHHPGIPRLLKVIDTDGVYGLIMEKMSGDTLEDLLTWDYTFSKFEITNIISQLIQIIEHLHVSGIYHRDIKTTNILWAQGDISLIDFGSARVIRSQSHRFNQDFWGIGDVFMRLAGSSQELMLNHQDLSIDGLSLSDNEMKVIKRLLYIEHPYHDMQSLSHDFEIYFTSQ